MASEVEDIARRKDGEDDGEKEMSSYDDVEENAVEELCEALGVPEDKREDVKSALGDYVKACVEKALDEDDKDEE